MSKEEYIEHDLKIKVYEEIERKLYMSVFACEGKVNDEEFNMSISPNYMRFYLSFRDKNYHIDIETIIGDILKGIIYPKKIRRLKQYDHSRIKNENIIKLSINQNN